MYKKAIPLSILFSALLSQAGLAASKQTVTVLSPVYKIDKIIKSMEGPQSSQPVYLLQSQPPELLWITGFKTEMVAADGVTPSLPEFMCHVNLDYNPSLHGQLFKDSTHLNARLLTLSQGQVNSQFPEGFGLPLLSNEPISMNTQVLNFNLERPDLQVRHKVTFTFVRDLELKKPMKPLFNTSGFGMALLEGQSGHYGIADVDESKHGPSCLPGESAPNAHGGSVYQDQFSRKFSGHWVVKPGREENHTNVTKYLNLPFDTTLHYAAVHLHPFSESLELRDITAKKRIFKSHARGFKNKIGLAYVDSFSSRKGVPLFKDHEYELISIYNNTTSINQDSMAVMMLFLLDKKFAKPAVDPLAAIATPPAVAVPAPVISTAVPVATARLRFHTTGGKLTAELYGNIAPQTVAQILSLVKAGVYDSTPFFRLVPNFVLQTTNIYGRTQPLSASQQALVHKLPAEFSLVKHKRGTLSMARADEDLNSGETSFSFLLADAPHLDGKYTVFGKVTDGWEVLTRMETTPRDKEDHPATPLQIIKVDVLDKPRFPSKI